MTPLHFGDKGPRIAFIIIMCYKNDDRLLEWYRHVTQDTHEALS